MTDDPQDATSMPVDAILTADNSLTHDIDFSAIPAKLKALPRWICWEWNRRSGKWVKVPIHPNGYTISVTDPTNWNDFETVAQAAKDRGCGLGICFNGDGLIGIDIDDCRDPITGDLSPFAAQMVRDLKTYWETSPSKTGVKGFVFGQLPEKFVKKHALPKPEIGSVEIYREGRFFTVTGQRTPGTSRDVEERATQVVVVYEKLLTLKPAKPVRPNPPPNLVSQPVSTTVPERGVNDDRQRVPFALAVIPSDDYDTWCSVGMALHSLGPDLLGDWIQWSRRSEKFEDGECERKWASFGRDGLTIASLFKLADEFEPSWRRVVSEARNDTTSLSSGKSTVVSVVSEPCLVSTPIWRPFPLCFLPYPLCDYIEAKATALDVDPAQIALPLLTALGAAIGNRRRLCVQDGWNVPGILWTAIVCESGSAKTPALKAALCFVQSQQTVAWELHQQEMNEFKSLEAYHKKSMAAWERNKTTSDNPPEPPQKPVLRQFIVSDCTVEALVNDLQENPQGLLLARDELAAWFGSHDRYASKGSADQAAYLEMYNAGPVSSNRKGSGRLYVPQASVAVTGTIQPGILRRVLGTEQRESGMQARFLWAFPERRVRGFPLSIVPQDVENDVATVFDRLWALDFDIGPDGRQRPLRLPMTQQALELFRGNTLAMRTEAHTLGADLHAAYSKLEEIPARLGLIIHNVRLAAGSISADSVEMVDESSIQSGIELTNWFKNETTRVYSMLRSKPPETQDNIDDQTERHLLNWITERCGSVTERDVYRNLSSKYRSAADATKALQTLVNKGLGIWTPVESTLLGGHPTRRFVVSA